MSSPFLDCPQTASLMVWMKLVVYTRSSLELQKFSTSTAPCGQCCVHAFLYRGRITEHAVGFVGQSHMGCVSWWAQVYDVDVEVFCGSGFCHTLSPVFW